MGYITGTKGFLLFVLLQMSLVLYTWAQENSTALSTAVSLTDLSNTTLNSNITSTYTQLMNDNTTLSSLLNASIVPTTITTTSITTKTTTTTTTGSTTPATNGKKCHKISCSGEICYQTSTTVAMCAPGQNFCMLKKTPSGTVVNWSGGCVEDCSKETPCTSSTSACIIECCNATTMSSCFKLTGVLNILGSGTVALHCHMQLIVFSFFLWFLSMGRSYG